MKKKRRYMAIAVIFVVFSVVSFVIPFEKNLVFWLSYAAGAVAILMQIYTLSKAFVDGSETKSKFYGFPIARVGAGYLGVQMVISIISMGMSVVIPMWVCIIIDVIVLGAFLLGIIHVNMVEDEIERQEANEKKDTRTMKKLVAATASFPARVKDETAKKELQNLAEKFRYSDPVSNDDTLDIEEELVTAIEELKELMTQEKEDGIKDKCRQISNMLEERNILCKAGK